MPYSGSIDLISGIRQKNDGDFPLVDSTAVRVTDDKRLNTVLDELSEASGSGVDNKINNAIGALDVSDTEVSNKFVTAVSESDGKISVTRAQPSASNISDFNTAVDNRITSKDLIYFADV